MNVIDSEWETAGVRYCAANGQSLIEDRIVRFNGGNSAVKGKVVGLAVGTPVFVRWENGTEEWLAPDQLVAYTDEMLD